MDLARQGVRERLALIERAGWESPVARELLEQVRVGVVVPLVARAGLRGPVAAQAEASGWEAAWDSLRRPSARAAENPVGMAWVAARRAVHAEASGRSRAPGPGRAPVGLGPSGWVSLDEAIARGWQPRPTGQDSVAHPGDSLGPRLDLLLRELEASGWERGLARDAVLLITENVRARADGDATGPWRCVAELLGLPHWRARRLAELLLGGRQWPGVPALMVLRGCGVLSHPAVVGALLSTSRQWSSGPRAHLAALADSRDLLVTHQERDGDAA